MSQIAFDPMQYKAQQRQGWGSVAAGWNDYWSIFEQGARPLSERLVELAQIQPGQNVLDIATGIGEPAVTAARRVGPKGRVVGIDLAQEMLVFARERATSMGLKNVEFLEMDAEALQFPESSFDAILCRLGLMFLPNLGSALEGMRRRLVPGGWLAAATQGPPDKFKLSGLAMQVVARHLQLPPPAPGTPGPSSLANPETLDRALRQAGFVDVKVGQMELAFEFSSAEAYTRFNQHVSAPVKAVLAKQSPEKQAEVYQAVTDAARKFAAADGTVKLTSEVNVAAGRR